MRYLWLDGFRGAAAIAVVIWHFRATLDIGGFDFGFLAVDLFFILSGMVLTIRFTREIEDGSLTFPKFAWQRLRRLYPMALITGLLVAVMNACDVPAAFAMKTGMWSVLTLIPFQAGFGQISAFPPNPAEWSLSAELVCNAIWFALLRRGRVATAVMFIACVPVFIGAALHHGSMDVGARAGLLNQGAAVARAIAGFGLGYFIVSYRLRPRIGAATAVALFLSACAAYQFVPGFPVGMGLVVIVCGAVMLAALMQSEPASDVMQKLCRYLGMLSFPLYMIHGPAERVAHLWYVSGANVYLSYAVVLLGSGVLATLLNEAVVGRLPSRLPFARGAVPAP